MTALIALGIFGWWVIGFVGLLFDWGLTFGRITVGQVMGIAFFGLMGPFSLLILLTHWSGWKWTRRIVWRRKL